MKKELQIIYIEDNPDDVGMAKRALTKAGVVFKMLVVKTEIEFTDALHHFMPDLILSDHSLPGFNSLEAFRITTETKPNTPFILLTGSVSEEFAVDCLLAGIDDYILKSNLIRLPSSINRILSKNKIKQEKNDIEALHAELQCTHKQIELKNKEITDSINYAKRIQDAILPHDRQLAREFWGAFVIYSPRNIVSGDFYWLANTITTDTRNLSLKVLAVFDCTGHGIPGAFLSLLSSAILNDTLKNTDINSPAQALKYLNQKLPFILNHNNKERITDGLDIGLCAIDLNERIVYYSGANRPLWIIRKAEGETVLLEFKGTKASIGVHTPKDKEFENITIPLQQGDKLYLFTDGVTDQFGGPNGKKLGRKRLKEILLHSAHMEMPDQKEYIHFFFNKWKGNLEQVDDMLIMGIEIN